MGFISAGYPPRSFLHGRGFEILKHPQTGTGTDFLLSVAQEQIWATKLNRCMPTGIKRLQLNIKVSSQPKVSSVTTDCAKYACEELNKIKKEMYFKFQNTMCISGMFAASQNM